MAAHICNTNAEGVEALWRWQRQVDSQGSPASRCNQMAGSGMSKKDPDSKDKMESGRGRRLTSTSGLRTHMRAPTQVSQRSRYRHCLQCRATAGVGGIFVSVSVSGDRLSCN